MIRRFLTVDDGEPEFAGWTEGGNYSGGGGGGGSTYNPNMPPFDPDRDFSLVAAHLTKPLTNPVTPEQDFYNNHLNDDPRAVMQDAAIRVPLLQYLGNNNYSENANNNAVLILDCMIEVGDADFALWAIEFFENNPDTTPQQFKSWFMGEAEGPDGVFDTAYWDNPNITFPAQNLPSWQNFSDAFPKNADGSGMFGPDVYNLVGGAPKDKRDAVLNDADLNNDHAYDNACALRVSRALNYSGVTIPNLPNKTFLGGDGKYYFLNARALNKWMRKTFGTNDGDQTTPSNNNHYHYTSSQGGANGANFPTLFQGKKGIFSMVSSSPSWASGHADALKDDGTCINNCHFDGPINYIDIWILN